MTEPTCKCNLHNVNTYGDGPDNPRYIRGYHNGCPIHASDEWRQRQQALAERAARVEAAMREARERP